VDRGGEKKKRERASGVLWDTGPDKKGRVNRIAAGRTEGKSELKPCVQGEPFEREIFATQNCGSPTGGKGETLKKEKCSGKTKGEKGEKRIGAE